MPSAEELLKHVKQNKERTAAAAAAEEASKLQKSKNEFEMRKKEEEAKKAKQYEELERRRKLPETAAEAAKIRRNKLQLPNSVMPAASVPAPASTPVPAKTNNAPKTNQATTNTTVAAVVGTASIAASNASTNLKSIAFQGTTLFSSTPMSGGDALKIILVILAVGMIIYFIIKSRIIQNAYNKISSVPSDSNNASIRKDELSALSPQADEMQQQRVGVFEGFKTRLDRFVNGGAAKEGFLTASDLPTLPTMPSATVTPVSRQIADVVSNLPKLPVLPSTTQSASATASNTMRVVDSEQALVNYSVLGCRCAGYLGPKMNGVFSEEDAIQLAIKMGCRLFIFDIDYLDRAPSTPVLVCRDANGNLLSNNVGSIAKAAASIVAFTKKQRIASTDPIIIVLSVRRLPNKSATSKESIAFMQEIAAQLVPIQQYLMRSAPQGDAQQQRLEEVLFKLPIKTFENQILLLTNLDTRGFRQLDIEVAPARNLDILVHARVYTNENSALFYYSLPSKSTTAAALVQTQEYYENIPPANYESEADKTRNTWSISMTAELEGAPDAAVLDVLVNQLGVQGIVIDPFAAGAKESAVYSTEFFARRSFILKPAEIAYKEPAVVTIAPPDKRLDANGGMLVSPTTN